MLPKYYEFLNSVKILSGNSALENIGHEFRNLGVRKPLVLTDKVLAEIGTLKVVLSAIDEGIDTSTVFTEIPADSSVKVVNAIKEVYIKNKCDSLLAIGGGSVIDTTKGVRMLLSQGEDDIIKLMGSEIIPRGIKIPFIVVPTTSGTGSEATLVAVIANTDKNIKMEFISYELLPDVAILDYRMTQTLPPKITASTGMDALCHAIEAYSCLQKNPLSDAYAITAINLIREYLPIATASPKDATARLALANASLMAGVAFSNSMVGLVHAIGHAMGGVAHIAHGVAMAILLPYVMTYNLEVCSSYYSELLIYLAGADVYASTKASERAQKSIDTIKEMLVGYNKTTGLPIKLSDAGVKLEQLKDIAKLAINDGAIINNLKGATSEIILKEILEKAF